MATVVQITWVRRYRNDGAAADFGVAFGKEANIEAAALDLDALLRGDHDSIPKEYEDKLNSAKALVSVVCGLSVKSMTNFMLSAIDDDEVKAFIKTTLKRKPRKRGASLGRLLSLSLSDMDQLERMAAILSVMRKLPDTAFTLCDHQPDWKTVRDLGRNNAFEIACKRDCGAVARFSICWEEDDEDDDGDDPEEDGWDEDDDFDDEEGEEDEADDEPPTRLEHRPRRPAMKNRKKR